MVKTLLALSMVASIALVTTGCGGGDGGNDDNTPPADTIAPTILTATPQHVVENTNMSIALTANEPVTFSIVDTTALFDLNGSSLTFHAPAYEKNATNEYNVTVKAKDRAGNIGPKIISFIVDPLKAKNIVVSTGDKNLTVLSNGKIEGPTGLIWLNENTAFTSYSDAVKYCEDADNGSGFRIARRDEILNLIDYSKGNDTDALLLENEFDKNDKATTWAEKVNNKYFSVNFVAGADGEEAGSDTPVSGGNAAQYAVMCVKGLPADAHTFKADENNASLIIDTVTGMVWTRVDTDNDATRRAVAPADNALQKQTAAEYCPTGFRLPSINELRTLVDYTDNSVNTLVVPERTLTNGVVLLWSSTKFTNSTDNKNYYLNSKDSLISAELVTEPLFVTCVKASK